VTISDKKLAVDGDGNGVVDYYNADVVTASDYYPFGMAMPGRKYSQSNSSYRYGFNGKEKSDEVNGEGNIYDYGFRIYNPRIAKFLSVDPLSDKYPFYTPYQFAGNSPILSLDIDGLEGDKNKNKTETSITIKVGTNKSDAKKLGSPDGGRNIDAMLMAANFVPTWQKDKVDRDIASGAQQPKLVLTDAQLTKFAATVMAESGNGMSFQQKLYIASVYYNRVAEQGFENGLTNSYAYATRFTSKVDGRQHLGKPNGWYMSMVVGMGDPQYASEPIPIAEQGGMTVGGQVASSISAYNATPAAQTKINDAIALKGMLKQTLFSNYSQNIVGSGFLSQGYVGDLNKANDTWTNWGDARAYYRLQEQGKVSNVLVIELTVGKGTTFIFDSKAVGEYFKNNPGMRPASNPQLKGSDFSQ
jgi:RHS repeat-associated protein